MIAPRIVRRSRDGRELGQKGRAFFLALAALGWLGCGNLIPLDHVGEAEDDAGGGCPAEGVLPIDDSFDDRELRCWTVHGPKGAVEWDSPGHVRLSADPDQDGPVGIAARLPAAAQLPLRLEVWYDRDAFDPAAELPPLPDGLEVEIHAAPHVLTLRIVVGGVVVVRQGETRSVAEFTDTAAARERLTILWTSGHVAVDAHTGGGGSVPLKPSESTQTALRLIARAAQAPAQLVLHRVALDSGAD